LARVRSELARTVKSVQDRVAGLEQGVAALGLGMDAKVGPDELTGDVEGAIHDRCLENHGEQGPAGPEFEHRWKFALPTDPENHPLKLYVGPGIWIRHDAMLVHKGDSTEDCGSVPGVYYVSAQLSRTGTSPAEYDPVLEPDTLAFAFTLATGMATFDQARTNDYPNHPGHAQGLEDTVRVLGMVLVYAGAITDFEQWSYHDFDDVVPLPDADTYDARRSTIRRNPNSTEDTYRADELYNVSGIPAQYDALAFFHETKTSEEETGYSKGVLKWAPPDGNGNGASDWGAQRSLEIFGPDTTDPVLQLWDWDAGTEISTLADGDTILVRACSIPDSGGDPILRYMKVQLVDALKADTFRISGTKLQGKKITVLATSDTGDWVDLVDLYTCP
jgi:hypothetical protein